MAGGLGISPDLLEGAEPSVAALLVAGDLDEGLMSRARDTGKFLYKCLEPQERVEKINSMVCKINLFSNFVRLFIIYFELFNLNLFTFLFAKCSLIKT